MMHHTTSNIRTNIEERFGTNRVAYPLATVWDEKSIDKIENVLL